MVNVLIAAALGAATLVGAPTREVAIEPVVDGVYAGLEIGLTDPRTFVIDTPDLWASVWAELVSDRWPTPATPSIDFANKTVLGIATNRLTGGYTLSIDRVTVRATDVVAHATLTVPGDDCMVTQALTQPHSFVAVPKVDKAVTFEVSTETYDCN